MGTLATPEVKTGGNLKVEIRRVIRASRQRVYEAWTRPEELKKWFGPAGKLAPAVETQVREGGSYRITVANCGADGKEDPGSSRNTAAGEYVQVIPNELLQFTWRGDWMPGEETLVTVRLRDAPGGTELVLTHEQFATAESLAGHEKGWNGSFDKLAGYLAG